MKKFLLLLLLPCVCMFGQENVYSKMYNMLGSNMYTTGNYTISMYDVPDAVNASIINYNGQGIAAISLISNSKYTTTDYWNFMSNFIGTSNRSFIGSSGYFAIQTNRGLILSQDNTNILFISKAVPNSDYSVREQIYTEILKPFFENKELLLNNLIMLGCYKHIEDNDQILISQIYAYLRRNTDDWWTNNTKTEDVFLLKTESDYYIFSAQGISVSKEKVNYSVTDNYIEYSTSGHKYVLKNNGILELYSNDKLIESYQ